MNPETRQMLMVRADDILKADDVFSALMGAEVQPRKDFIHTYARSVKNLDV